MLGNVSVERLQLRLENARLKEELDRLCAVAKKFLGKSVSSLAGHISPTMPSSVLEIGVGNNIFAGFNSVVAPTISALPDYLPGFSSNPLDAVAPTMGKNMEALLGSDRSMLLELALAAMEELMSMAQMEEPLWLPSSQGGPKALNYEQYRRTFRPIAGISPVGSVSEASRETRIVSIDSVALVETLMDAVSYDLLILLLQWWMDSFSFVTCLLLRNAESLGSYVPKYRGQGHHHGVDIQRRGWNKRRRPPTREPIVALCTVLPSQNTMGFFLTPSFANGSDAGGASRPLPAGGSARSELSQVLQAARGGRLGRGRCRR